MESRLVGLLRDIYVQAFGRQRNWAGMWGDCGTCKQPFAYGWNWSDDLEEDPAPALCPTCRIPLALKELGIEDEKIKSLVP